MAQEYIFYHGVLLLFFKTLNISFKFRTIEYITVNYNFFKITTLIVYFLYAKDLLDQRIHFIHKYLTSKK